MTIQWNKLPLEIWEIIFHHVGTAKELADCRLVCKVWDPLVKKAMFGQRLVLQYESKVVNICNLIQQKPSICKLIRGIQLTDWNQLPVSIQDTLFNHLKELTNLIGLELQSDSKHDLSEIDSIIAKCQHHLKRFNLAVKAVELPRTNDDDFKQWLLENVEQSPSVVDIRLVRGHHPPGLLDYLLFKFPNVSRAYFCSITATTSQAVQRILTTMQTIPLVSFNDVRTNDPNDVKDAFVAFRRSKNSVAIRRCSDVDMMIIGAMNLTVSTNERKDKTVFRVYVSGNLVQQILAIVNSTLGNVEVGYRDNTDFGFTHDNTREPPLAFGKLLTTISSACRVKFFDTHVSFSYFPDAKTISTSLRKLELCGSIIVGGVLSALGQAAPNLTHLTLNTCILDTMHPQNYHVDMLSSDLDTLSIIAQQRSLWYQPIDCSDGKFRFAETRLAALDFIEKSIKITKNEQIVPLLISTLSTKQHFVLKPGSPTTNIRVISQQDYLRYTAGWPGVTIECKSLKVLKLDLGRLVVELKLGVDRPIESIEDWIEESRLTLSNQMYPSGEV